MRKLVFSTDLIGLMIEEFKKGLNTTKDPHNKSVITDYIATLKEAKHTAKDDNVVFIVESDKILVGVTNMEANTTIRNVDKMVAHLVYVSLPNPDFEIYPEGRVTVYSNGKAVFSFTNKYVKTYEDLLNSGLEEGRDLAVGMAMPDFKDPVKETQVFIVKDKAILNLINNSLTEVGLPNLAINEIVPVEIARSLSKTEKAAFLLRVPYSSVASTHSFVNEEEKAKVLKTKGDTVKTLKVTFNDKCQGEYKLTEADYNAFFDWINDVRLN